MSGRRPFQRPSFSRRRPELYLSIPSPVRASFSLGLSLLFRRGRKLAEIPLVQPSCESGTE